MKQRICYLTVIATLILCSVCAAAPTVSISGAPVGSITEGTQIDVTCVWDYNGYSDRGYVRLVRFDPDFDPFMLILGTKSSPADTGTHTFSVTVEDVDTDITGVVYVCSLQKSSGGQIDDAWSEPFTILDSTPSVFLYAGLALFLVFLWLAFRKRPKSPRR